MSGLADAMTCDAELRGAPCSGSAKINETEGGAEFLED